MIAGKDAVLMTPRIPKRGFYNVENLQELLRFKSSLGTSKKFLYPGSQGTQEKFLYSKE